MNPFSQPAFLFLLVSLSTSLHLHAQESSIDWQTFNVDLVSQQIIPGYRALEEQADKLKKASHILCHNLDKDAFDQTIHQFNQTIDAWQRIQHVHFGPIEYDMRSASMQFWPDKKNFIGKQLSRLIAKKNDDALQDSFRKTSVAVKGLPAMERLLYAEDALSQLSNDRFRCKVLVRISENVHEISHHLTEEWKSPMLPQFRDATQVDGYFEDDIDAATALLKIIIEPIEIIRDLKLKRPMGSAIDKAKYKRLESWRGQRSKRNIVLNLETIEEAYLHLSKHLSETENVEVQQLFKEVKQALNGIENPMEVTIVKPLSYESMSKLVIKLTDLHKTLSMIVSKQGIHLGFNSRDGD